MLWYHGRRPGPLCPDFVGYDSPPKLKWPGIWPTDLSPTVWIISTYYKCLADLSLFLLETFDWDSSIFLFTLPCFFRMWVVSYCLPLQNILSHFVQLNSWLHILLLSSEYSIVCCLVIYIFVIGSLGAVHILRTCISDLFWPIPPCTAIVHLWKIHHLAYILPTLTHRPQSVFKNAL